MESRHGLYPKNADNGALWSRFRFLHPEFLVFSHTDYKINPFLFAQQVRSTFFPLDIPLEEAETEFYAAMNRGVRALNTLVNTNLPELADLLAIKEVSDPPSLYLFLEKTKVLADEARVRNDSEKRLLAYKGMQAVELAYRVLMIDTDGEVQASLRHYHYLHQWFSSLLGVAKKERIGRDDLSFSWETAAGVYLYGQEERPFRSRVKYLDERGSIKYSSILLKMMRKKTVPGALKDNAAVELIVENEADSEALVRYFRESRPLPRLEEFDQRSSPSLQGDNPASSGDVRFVKFIVRPPVPMPSIAQHPLGEKLCQRVPTEVQILTLDDFVSREESQTARHEEYKRKQFLGLFPALFPKRIYAPFLRMG